MAAKNQPKKTIPPSLIISFSLILVFALLANSQWFIPLETQQKLAFNLFLQPLNALSFLFVHTGVTHLLANVMVVFFLGFVVEQFLPRRHVFALFFGVGILSFALFNFFAPEISGVGASGGAIALTTVALIFSPKKSFNSLVAVLILSLIILVAVLNFQNFLDQGLAEQIQKTETELQSAIQTQNLLVVEIKSRELKTITRTIEEKKLNRQFERETRIANGVHLIASLLAILYLFVFFPEITKKHVHQNAVALRKFILSKKVK